MAHLYAAYKCSYCYEIPETAPLFHCPNRHQYCYECFKKLQRLYRGIVEGGSCCLICKYSGRFERSDVTTEFLKKLKKKPGIGRPCRYSPKPLQSFDEGRFLNESIVFMEASQGDGLLNLTNNKQNRILRAVSSTNLSKRPLRCLHNDCKKSVAVSSLVSHFKHDHGEVPCFRIEKRGDLTLQFNLGLVEFYKTCCLAMVTVYEHNLINVVRSQSSQSVIDTCNKLSSKIPLNTFWLMMSSSSDCSKNNSYTVFWLFSNSEDRYYCTLELSAIDDKMSVSSFCSAVCLSEGRSVMEVARNMNCLFVNFGTFLALAGHEDKVHLRVVVH